MANNYFGEDYEEDFGEGIWTFKRNVIVLFQVARISVLCSLVLIVLGAIFNLFPAKLIGWSLFMASLLFETIHYKFFYYYTYRGRRFALLSKSGKIRVILLYSNFLIYMFIAGLYELFLQRLPPEAFNWYWLVGYLLFVSTLFTTPKFWDFKNKIHTHYGFLMEKENLKLKKEDSERRKSLLPLAKESYRNKNYQVALNCYEELSIIYPNIRGYLFKRGIILNELKYYNEALETFQELLELSRSYKFSVSEKIYKMGKRMYYVKNYQEGLEYFNQGTLLFPKEARFWVRRGNMLGHLKRYEEAITSFEKALQLSPTYKFALMCKNDMRRKLDALEFRSFQRKIDTSQRYRTQPVPSKEKAILRFLTDNQGKAFTSTALINRIKLEEFSAEIESVLSHLVEEKKINRTAKDNSIFYSI